MIECEACAEYVRAYGGGVCEKHDPPGTIRFKFQVHEFNAELMELLTGGAG